MLKLKKVAITGGIASGKTTLCRFFEEKGAYVLLADKIVHELLIPTTELGKRIIKLLGPSVVVDGFFDRKKIAAVVFNEEELLAKLEQLLHPEVQKVIETRYREVSEKNQKYSLFVVEIPLLYESNMDTYFDQIVVVTADPDKCQQRWGNAFEYERRLKRQMHPVEKAKKADFVIENNGDLAAFKSSFEKIYEQLTRV